MDIKEKIKLKRLDTIDRLIRWITETIEKDYEGGKHLEFGYDPDETLRDIFTKFYILESTWVQHTLSMNYRKSGILNVSFKLKNVDRNMSIDLKELEGRYKSKVREERLNKLLKNKIC